MLTRGYSAVPLQRPLLVGGLCSAMTQAPPVRTSSREAAAALSSTFNSLSKVLPGPSQALGLDVKRAVGAHVVHLHMLWGDMLYTCIWVKVKRHQGMILRTPPDLTSSDV